MADEDAEPPQEQVPDTARAWALAPSYLARLPEGLCRALADGRWLPIVGAGISACAETDQGRRPPGWADLAEQLARALASPVDHPGREGSVPGSGPIDLISAFADMFGRAAMVERLSELLLVNEVRPSEVHHAFARLPFEHVVTTNVDFLLEEGYRYVQRPYVTLIGESRLSGARRPEKTCLLKFHGDLDHPNELVMTEEDYDGFLRRNPLLGTFLASWLLAKEPVFFGYSLDDADFRDVLGLLRERLGRMTRPAWVVLASDPRREKEKFTRRNIRPIVLDEHPDADRAKVLERFFGELRGEWARRNVDQVSARTDATSAELRRPPVAPQFALFVVDPALLGLYRDWVFPSIPDAGLLPISIDDVSTQDPALRPMAIDLALEKAAVVVYDRAGRNPVSEDYVERRAGDRFKSVTAPSTSTMAQWTGVFGDGLVNQLRQDLPSSTSLRAQCDDMARQRQWNDLLLTGLAMLEAQLRRTPEVDVTTLSTGTTSSRRLDRLRNHFGETDLETVMAAVRLRHQILRDPLGDLREVEPHARRIVEVMAHQNLVPST